MIHWRIGALHGRHVQTAIYRLRRRRPHNFSRAPPSSSPTTRLQHYHGYHQRRCRSYQHSQGRMRAASNLPIGQLLLALGPTTPLSLQPPPGSRILWVTFTDGQNLLNGPRVTIVPPTHLTDLSLTLEKLSKTRTSRIPLIVGDFLDNVLSVSSSSAGLYSFLCKLFTRIRTNGQTAFLLATEEMHESKKTAILKRFADVVIEYRAIQDAATHRLEARILDHIQGHYSVWDSSENPEFDGGQFLSSVFARSGRRKILQNPMAIRF